MSMVDTSDLMLNTCVKTPHNCLDPNDKSGINKDKMECCSQSDNDPPGKHGTWVAKGSCNRKTGHPTLPHTRQCPSQTAVEGYDGGDDSGECNHWKWALIILACITVILGIGFIYIGIKYQRLIKG